MKRNFTFSFSIIILIVFLFSLSHLQAQNVGIGTTTPTNKLHVVGASADPDAIMQVTQSSSGHGIRSSIQSASASSLASSSAVIGDAIAGNGVAGTAQTGTGVYGYSVDGPGLFGTSSFSAAVRGFCTGSGAGGQFYNTSTGAALITGPGNVGIDVASPVHKLDVSSDLLRTGNFLNTAVNLDQFGLYTSCNNTPHWGYGLQANGGYVGVQAVANLTGVGNRYAFRGNAANGDINYGISGSASGGTTAFGIYGDASGGTNNYAGYFNGNVFTTASYLPSDRKLKKDILLLTNALTIVEKLNPTIYSYRTGEYKQMHLPASLQYGLIADEVLEVLPGAVIKAVQPAVYADRNEKGNKLYDEVEFNAINYTQMIPVLIAAVKEQQSLIISQQKKIEILEKRLSAMERKN